MKGPRRLSESFETRNRTVLASSKKLGCNLNKNILNDLHQADNAVVCLLLAVSAPPYADRRR